MKAILYEIYLFVIKLSYLRFFIFTDKFLFYTIGNVYERKFPLNMVDWFTKTTIESQRFWFSMRFKHGKQVPESFNVNENGNHINIFPPSYLAISCMKNISWWFNWIKPTHKAIKK